MLRIRLDCLAPPLSHNLMAAKLNQRNNHDLRPHPTHLSLVQTSDQSVQTRALRLHPKFAFTLHPHVLLQRKTSDEMRPLQWLLASAL